MIFKVHVPQNILTLFVFAGFLEVVVTLIELIKESTSKTRGFPITVKVMTSTFSTSKVFRAQNCFKVCSKFLFLKESIAMVVFILGFN